MDLRDRIVSSVREQETGCWIWQKSKQPTGYGQLRVGKKTLYAHRVAYEVFKGPIPEGLQIDHLCRNRECVNPEHLDAVSQRTNILRGVGSAALNSRKTECAQKHPYDGENLLLEKRKNGRNGRRCRVCVQRNRSTSYRRRKERREEEE